MNFEQALATELETITGLSAKVFPLFAPDAAVTPFVVYRKANIRFPKVLDGFGDRIEGNYDILVLASNYPDLQTNSDLVIAKLKSMLFRTIGTAGPTIYDITITQNADTYDYRGDSKDVYIANINIEIKY